MQFAEAAVSAVDPLIAMLDSNYEDRRQLAFGTLGRNERTDPDRRVGPHFWLAELLRFGYQHRTFGPVKKRIGGQ